MNNPLSEAPFLGRGLAFPPTFDKSQRDIEMVSGAVDVQQSLAIILATRPGERVLSPTFGASLDEFIFEPLDFSNITLMEDRVRIALIRHEPRIEVNEVRVNEDNTLQGRILIEVDYTIRSTNSRFNLVFPFYLQEATDVNI